MNQSSVNDSATPRQDSHVPDGASPHQEQPAEQAPQPDITLDEVVAAVSDLIEAKKLQFSAQWEMVGAEQNCSDSLCWLPRLQPWQRLPLVVFAG